MVKEPIIKSYYSLDEENQIKEDEIKEKAKKTDDQIEKFSPEDEKAYTVGLITIIFIVILGITILSWWLINRNQNKEEVLGESEKINVEQEIPADSSPAIQPQEETIEETVQETYTVQAGDTLYSIGKKFKVDYNDIIELNGIENTQTLRPGQKLKIPISSSNTNINQEGQNETQD